MIATSRHIIKQQILDLTISNLKDQEEMSTAVSEIYKRSIDSILDEICHELIPVNRVVKIDSLVVDIGHLKYDQLALDFPKAIKTSIKQALFEQIRDKEVQSDMANEAVTVYQNKENALIAYLKTGLIPWYYDGDLPKLISEFSSKKIKSHSQLSIEISAIFKEEANRIRVVHFFEEKVLYSFLLEKLSKGKRIILTEFTILKNVLGKLKVISNISVTNTSMSGDATSLLEMLKPKKEVYDTIMVRLIHLSATHSYREIKHLIEIVPQKYTQSLQELFLVVENNELNKIKTFTSEELLLIQKFLKNTKNIPKLKIRNKEPEITLSQKRQIDIEEGIVVKNSGLILIWPYLQAFFRGLNIMQDKSFINDQKAIKAIHLLHYLVFQSEESNETEWVLNKLLCGIEVTDFIPEEMNISDDEKKECDNLLSALINNWPALKNTSPNSLRQTFLQRDGLLSRNENGWSLKIEREAYDILLDKLTWSISVIKLPWNNYMIHTEW